MSQNYSHLSREQRYKIEALKNAGFSQTKIAEQIGVHKSRIYFEEIDLLHFGAIQNINRTYRAK